MKTTRILLAAAIVAAAGLFAACEDHTVLQTETQSVAAEGAKTAEVELRMGAGQLRLAGADQSALMEATFRFNRSRYRPEVDYHVSGTTGVLRVSARRHVGIMFGHVRNEWDLRLTKSIPADLTVKLGAGESRLDLRGIELSGLDIDMGVGEMRLDLSGPRTRSFDVKIDGGVGSGTLILPSEAGVRVKVDGGIGSVNAHGLAKSGHVYTNDAYGKSPVTIDISIDAGIGSLDLRVEPSGSAKF